MKRHETPHELAIALSRHAPRKIRALLDPAVGTGNLIVPLLNRLRKSKSRVYCVDSDIKAIRSVSHAYGRTLPRSAKFIHSDFLAWSARPRRPRFDCIVMNPPFAATKANLYALNELKGTPKKSRYMPLEAAFVSRAIELLKDGGRLLTVLPCSVITSESLQWLRDEMLAKGAVRFVHELPPRCFPGVESRMYLLVFEKGATQRRVALLNHDLHEPERVTLSLENGPVTRFDYGFVSARLTLAQLREHRWLRWAPVREAANVIRGDIESPLGPRCVVHSTDFADGFWNVAERHDRTVLVSPDRCVKAGDLLMCRVGRNAYRSVGRGKGIAGMACSDCVLIIRPKRTDITLRLLFAMRVMLSQPWARSLIERGTGARYISYSALLDLPVPMGVVTRYPKQFRKFADAERANSSATSARVVEAVAKRLSEMLT